MDAEIEEVVRNCSSCQVTGPSHPVAQLHPWEWPSQPWSRLHIDFVGPFMGHMYLIIIDSHSKWLDVQIMQSVSTSKTVKKLWSVFATHGLTGTIVSDNDHPLQLMSLRNLCKLMELDTLHLHLIICLQMDWQRDVFKH